MFLHFTAVGDMLHLKGILRDILKSRKGVHFQDYSSILSLSVQIPYSDFGNFTERIDPSRNKASGLLNITWRKKI
jgi:hypothetical protein